MLDFDMPQNPDLPYVELPDNARKAAIENISRRGFTPLEHYNLFSLRENQPLTTNILCFTHPVHRTPEYTGITVFNAVDGYDDRDIVSYLARSAALLHLIHRDDQFAFWVCPMQENNTPTTRLVESHISYDQLDNALSKYEVDLRPQRIIDVKQGRDTFSLPAFRDIQSLQLSLWAAEVSGKQLIDHFATTVSQLRESLSKTDQIQEGDRDTLTTTIAIQLLGAIILADTGVLGDDLRRHRATLDKLIWMAAKKFSRYFKQELFEKYYTEAEEAYQLLQRICYATFVPDMLRELYGAAYSEKERKETGSYDTPLYLTRRIWKNIPVEFLAPEQRVVADMTCGWGSFLVAGYERLSNLQDMEGFALRDYLYGNDNADFTAQLAGLGLLLSTSEDSWNIHNDDALEWTWLQTHQPGIIVGNPPFGGNRKQQSTDNDSTTQKRRQERANIFLQHALDRLAPGGYLAMIMPRSFAVVEASLQLRKQLLETCDILELWELPTEVFSGPMQRTIVIFAQKRAFKGPLLSAPVRVRTLQSGTLNAFKTLGIVTTSGLASDQAAWGNQSRKSAQSTNTHLIDYYLTLPEHSWHTIREFCRNLRDLTEIFRGATRGQNPNAKKWLTFDSPRKVLWLTGIRNVMPRSFFIDYAFAETIVYPNDLERPRIDKEHLLAGLKILVPYNADTSWGQRIRVAIEQRGHYVSNSFYVVVLNPTIQQKYITHEVIAAVMNWDVSNAWIVEHLKSPDIPKRVMDTIPFPRDLSEEDCKNLTQAVLRLEKAAYAHEPEPAEANIVIDAILKKAYHLDDTTFARLHQVKEWDTKPQITLDPLPYSDEADCFISGIVDSVNAEEGTITLWIKGFEELQTVRITSSMPGWLLRPDIEFRTEIPRKYIKRGIIDATTNEWGTFRPQPFTYMSEEELLEGFASLLP
ncbi:MAG: N-6 DNA methylase [Ktedonobacteraceae bacterium]